ncbi:MAG TPA: hypothetical protein VLJ68_07405 [Chitinophagaceae bacterium]|nr:hypothetical protein [Chitinophagaceae bacterium]
MRSPALYINQNRAAIFDWVVFITSILLGFIFPSLSDFISFSWFSGWMLIAFLMYVAGSWMKHIPLYLRLIRAGKSPREMPMLLLLILGHWIIIFTAILFAEPVIRKIIGVRPAHEGDQVSGRFLLMYMLVAGLVTWLVYRHRKKIKNAARFSVAHLFYRELVADVFLCISIATFTFAFWEKGVMTIFNGNSIKGFSDVWALFLMLSFAFVLFYLPLRYLFLVEDYSNNQTWRRMMYIFGFLILRSLLVILHV